MNLPNIFCGTDFSLPARRTSEACAALAAKLGIPLVLAHVHQPQSSSGDALETSGEEASRRLLASEAASLRERGAVVAEEFLTGIPDETLLAAAGRRRAGVIVLASRERRGATERWLFGSVAEYLAENATAPTLVVRDPDSLEKWLESGDPLGVFVAVDLASTADTPLRWAKELLRAGPVNFTAGHVNWVPDEAMRLGFQQPASFVDESPEVQEILARDLRKRTRQLFGEVPVRIMVEPRWGRADLPLISLAKKAGAELIVVGTRQRHGLSRLFDESVSRGTLHDAPMNVVIVPLSDPSPAEVRLPVFRRVLAPTDFSPLANHALAHAYALVAPGGTVCLAHVADLPGQDDVVLGSRLRALIPAEAAERGIHTEVSVITETRAADAIGHLAARFGADAICLGSHGRSGVPRVLLGSVAQEVVENSRCPVLIVRQT